MTDETILPEKYWDGWTHLYLLVVSFTQSFQECLWYHGELLEMSAETTRAESKDCRIHSVGMLLPSQLMWHLVSRQPTSWQTMQTMKSFLGNGETMQTLLSYRGWEGMWVPGLQDDRDSISRSTILLRLGQYLAEWHDLNLWISKCCTYV